MNINYFPKLLSVAFPVVSILETHHRQSHIYQPLAHIIPTANSSKFKQLSSDEATINPPLTTPWYVTNMWIPQKTFIKEALYFYCGANKAADWSVLSFIKPMDLFVVNYQNIADYCQLSSHEKSRGHYDEKTKQVVNHLRSTVKGNSLSAIS